MTDAIKWRPVRIYVANQINHEEVCWIAFPGLNAKNEDHLQQLFLFSKEGMTTDAMDAFYQKAHIFNRLKMSAMLRSEISDLGPSKRDSKVIPGDQGGA